MSFGVLFDVTPTWLSIARQHMAQAIESEVARNAAWAQDEPNARGRALQAELEACMQTIVASTIALDAFYARLKDIVSVPADLSKAWQKNKTARAVQVFETMELAFELKGKFAADVGSALPQIFRYRDMAVHPLNSIQEPVEHPDLGVGMERRFVAFRAHNARMAFNASASIIWELAHTAEAKSEAIAKYAAVLAKRLDGVFPQWPPE